MMKSFSDIMRQAIRTLLRWTYRAYRMVAILIGTFFILHITLLLHHNATKPGSMPVLLPNGFYYTPDREGNVTRRLIADRNEKQVVAPDVEMIAWHGDSVYGYRRGRADEVYYFICDYDKDCSKSQHLNDVEFDRLLKERGLPEFGPPNTKTYDELLEEQDKKYPELEIINGRMVVPD